MSENTANNKNVRDDEIDLLDLFRRMGRTINRWLNALGRAFLISVVFLLKRWLPLSFSLALGIGASYLFKGIIESSYTSDLVLRTNAASTVEMITYLNRLHTFCKEQNKPALAQSLVMDPAQVDNIGDISAFWVIDKGRDGIPDLVDYNNSHDVYDTINVRMLDRLDIRVKINSPQELTVVRNGLIKFIDSDQLFQERNRVRLRQDSVTLARLNYDMLQLDSLQKVKYFEETRNMHPKEGGQMVFLQEHQTQLVYPDIQSLLAKKQALESERDLYPGIVTVLSEFTIPAKRSNGGMFYGKYLIPAFFFAALLILIALANRKKLTEVYNKY